jgi:hypothetical protein
MRVAVEENDRSAVRSRRALLSRAAQCTLRAQLLVSQSSRPVYIGRNAILLAVYDTPNITPRSPVLKLQGNGISWISARLARFESTELLGLLGIGRGRYVRTLMLAHRRASRRAGIRQRVRRAYV